MADFELRSGAQLRAGDALRGGLAASFSRTGADTAQAVDVATRVTSVGVTASDTTVPARPPYGFSNGLLGASFLGSQQLGGGVTQPGPDIATWKKGSARTASDNALAVDVATDNVALGRSATDAALAADVATRVAALARSASDTASGINLRPSALGWGLLGQALLGGTTNDVQDIATFTKTTVRSVSDNAHAVDAAHASGLILFRFATDNAFAADSTSVAGTGNRTAFDRTNQLPNQGYLGFGLLGLAILGSGSQVRPADTATASVYHPLRLARYAHDWVAPFISTLPDSGVLGQAAFGWWPLGNPPRSLYAQMDSATAVTGHIHANENAFAIDTANPFAHRFAGDNAFAIDVATRVVSAHLTAADNAFCHDVATYVSHLLGDPGCIHAVLTLLYGVQAGIRATAEIDPEIEVMFGSESGIIPTAAIESEVVYVATTPGGLLLPASITGEAEDDAIALGGVRPTYAVTATIEVIGDSVAGEIDVASIEAALAALYAVPTFQGPENC